MEEAVMLAVSTTMLMMKLMRMLLRMTRVIVSKIFETGQQLWVAGDAVLEAAAAETDFAPIGSPVEGAGSWSCSDRDVQSRTMSL